MKNLQVSLPSRMCCHYIIKKPAGINYKSSEQNKQSLGIAKKLL